MPLCSTASSVHTGSSRASLSSELHVRHFASGRPRQIPRRIRKHDRCRRQKRNCRSRGLRTPSDMYFATVPALRTARSPRMCRSPAALGAVIVLVVRKQSGAQGPVFVGEDFDSQLHHQLAADTPKPSRAARSRTSLAYPVQGPTHTLAGASNSRPVRLPSGIFAPLGIG